MNQTNITISTRSIITFISMVIVIALLYLAKDVILLLFASFVIASALLPVVDWMSKKINRGLAVAIIYIVGLLVLFILVVPFFTILVQQVNLFIEDFPTYWKRVQVFLVQWEVMLKSTGIIPDYSQMFTSLTTFSKEILSQSINITLNIVTGIAMTFTLAFIVLFLLLDKDEITNAVLNLFPKHNREQAKLIITTASKKVGGYVRGQLLLMFLVGAITAIALAAIKIKYALLLGIVAGILEIIPIVGPILSAVPAVIIALAVNPWYALLVVAVYFGIQRLENHILTPLILGKFLELHPIVIISAVLIAASTLGVFGVILSPAIAASLYILLQELYIKKINAQENV